MKGSDHSSHDISEIELLFSIGKLNETSQNRLYTLLFMFGIL